MVSELSRLYQVSEETIRRDLEKLENDGLVIKSYGGAVLNEHSIFDLPFNIRKNQMVVEKQQMAAIIADMVRDGEAVMLDASSTAVYVARKLKEKKKLTVITNSVEIIVELFDVPEWNVISTGGFQESVLSHWWAQHEPDDQFLSRRQGHHLLQSRKHGHGNDGFRRAGRLQQTSDAWRGKRKDPGGG